MKFDITWTIVLIIINASVVVMGVVAVVKNIKANRKNKEREE